MFAVAIFQSTLSVRRATGTDETPVPTYDVFQSTLSVRRATGLHVLIVEAETISIHALRKESDPCSWTFLSTF